MKLKEFVMKAVGDVRFTLTDTEPAMPLNAFYVMYNGSDEWKTEIDRIYFFSHQDHTTCLIKLKEI